MCVTSNVFWQIQVTSGLSLSHTLRKLLVLLAYFSLFHFARLNSVMRQKTVSSRLSILVGANCYQISSQHMYPLAANTILRRLFFCCCCTADAKAASSLQAGFASHLCSLIFQHVQCEPCE